MMNQKEACMMQSNMRCSQMNQAQLLHWIDKVSFAVMEFTLYLDSHPRDRNAIECFNHYAALRREALQMYAERFGPLTIDTANPEEFWKWAEQPWPWEGGIC